MNTFFYPLRMCHMRSGTSIHPSSTPATSKGIHPLTHSKTLIIALNWLQVSVCAVVLVKPRSIPKTTSGKIQRHKYAGAIRISLYVYIHSRHRPPAVGSLMTCRPV